MNDGSLWTSLRNAVSEAPLALKAFVGFSLVAVAAEVALFFNGELRAAVLPHTGWVPSMAYLFGIVMVLALMMGRSRWQLFWLSAALGVYMLIQGSAMIGRIGVEDANPYLYVSWWRPIWVLVIPGMWIAVLWSRSVRQYLAR